MAIPQRPRLRQLEVVPTGTEAEPRFELRDPEGFGDRAIVPYVGMITATLLDGRHTLAEIQAALRKQLNAEVPLADIESFIGQLDEANLLATERFERYRREVIQKYATEPVRPATHAGGSYEEDADELRRQLDDFFTREKGPGAIDWSRIDQSTSTGGRRLVGILSPHIDPYRGGPALAWAYKQVAEQSDADLFVIFGTAHAPTADLFSLSRKDFDTPLGVVKTDRHFVDRVAEHLASSVAGRQLILFGDEWAHRGEHSIEFQAVFLQHILGGRRPFRIVPVLVGSFEAFMETGIEPDDAPELQAFVAAIRAAADEYSGDGHSGNVCYISGADLAHIGQHFGDDWLLDDKHLAEQSDSDRELLEAACRCDSAGLFRHVALEHDRRRICGLSPTYLMLEAIHPAHGELLVYDQAVESDRTACVSFAAAAFYGEYKTPGKPGR